jgi:hypothetical protein
MAYHSFVRLAEGEPIPIPADSIPMALALLGRQEKASLSLEGEGEPAYVFASSDHHTFWCKPRIPVYRA